VVHGRDGGDAQGVALAAPHGRPLVERRQLGGLARRCGLPGMGRATGSSGAGASSSMAERPGRRSATAVRMAPRLTRGRGRGRRWSGPPGTRRARPRSGGAPERRPPSAGGRLVRDGAGHPAGHRLRAGTVELGPGRVPPPCTPPGPPAYESPPGDNVRRLPARAMASSCGLGGACARRPSGAAYRFRISLVMQSSA
jgi:hypothetical protein